MQYLYGPRDSFDVEHGVTLNGDTFSEIKGSSVLIMEFLQWQAIKQWQTCWFLFLVSQFYQTKVLSSIRNASGKYNS